MSRSGQARPMICENPLGSLRTARRNTRKHSADAINSVFSDTTDAKATTRRRSLGHVLGDQGRRPFGIVAANLDDAERSGRA